MPIFGTMHAEMMIIRASVNRMAVPITQHPYPLDALMLAHLMLSPLMTSMGRSTTTHGIHHPDT